MQVTTFPLINRDFFCPSAASLNAAFQSEDAICANAARAWAGKVTESIWNKHAGPLMYLSVGARRGKQVMTVAKWMFISPRGKFIMSRYQSIHHANGLNVTPEPQRLMFHCQNIIIFTERQIQCFALLFRFLKLSRFVLYPQF